MIQLHGDEDSSYIRKLKDHTDLPVIKALRVRDTEQILRAQELPCEYLLLDTYTANAYGGAGAGFDWSMIPELTKPFFLAGGISTDNLVQAASCQPYCIDVSSGAETQGRKDRMRIAQLVAMVRTINEYNECKRSLKTMSKWKIRNPRRPVHTGNTDERCYGIGRSI